MFDFAGQIESSHPQRAAKTLARGLEERKLLFPKPRIHNWAKAIEKFLKTSEIDPDFFDSILDWYLKHISDKFMPQAYSAQTFCEKFAGIMLQKRIYEERNPPDETPTQAPEVTRVSRQEFLKTLRGMDEIN